MVAFGAERPWRYVCEENMEICPADNRDLDIDLEPEWTTDVKSEMFQPPDDLVLRHGGELEDDGITMNCLGELKVGIFSLGITDCFDHKPVLQITLITNPL